MNGLDLPTLFRLLDGLRERGVTYFKSGDLELGLGGVPQLPDLPMPEVDDDSEIDEKTLYHSAVRPPRGA